ncbi:hypothetical protein [Dictyobacter kobayashii]|uniref:hypothetical protein n=1 Tax=Dictyobacter kobayashii TaxID=2014872 RepID=UPI000F8215CD|nr:hypothetical protein [Dictyobacter kobayashii]
MSLNNSKLTQPMPLLLTAIAGGYVGIGMYWLETFLFKHTLWMLLVGIVSAMLGFFIIIRARFIQQSRFYIPLTVLLALCSVIYIVMMTLLLMNGWLPS